MKKKNIIVIRIQGGLGNQIFQYAFYKKIKSKYPNSIVKLDISSYKQYSPHNGYELEKVFSIPKEDFDYIHWFDLFKYFHLLSYLPILKWKSRGRRDNSFKLKLVNKINYLIEKRNIRITHKKDNIIQQEYISFYPEPTINNLNYQNYYFDGTWFNCNYDLIKKELVQCLQPKKNIDNQNLRILNEIKKNNSVSIHIRKGDYIQCGYTVLGEKYYKAALEKMKNIVKNPKFYIFSDDMKYSQGFLSKYLSENDAVYINNNNGKEAYKDLILMSNCKHNIIANSTFSLAAILLENKDNRCIIAPEIWNQGCYIWDNSWIKIRE